MRILVLDDSSFARRMIVSELIALGIAAEDIDQAQTGDEAMELTQKNAYDLFILDIVMDGIDGIDVLKAVKTIQPVAKIIMCSSSSADEVVKEIVGLGIQGFLVKPFKSDDFRKTIAQQISLPNGLSVEAAEKLTVKCHVCDLEMIEVNLVNTVCFYCPQKCMQIGPIFSVLVNQQDLDQEYEIAKRRRTETNEQ